MKTQVGRGLLSNRRGSKSLNWFMIKGPIGPKTDQPSDRPSGRLEDYTMCRDPCQGYLDIRQSGVMKLQISREPETEQRFRNTTVFNSLTFGFIRLDPNLGSEFEPRLNFSSCYDSQEFLV